MAYQSHLVNVWIHNFDHGFAMVLLLGPLMHDSLLRRGSRYETRGASRALRIMSQQLTVLFLVDKYISPNLVHVIRLNFKLLSLTNWPVIVRLGLNIWLDTLF